MANRRNVGGVKSLGGGGELPFCLSPPPVYTVPLEGIVQFLHSLIVHSLSPFIQDKVRIVMTSKIVAEYNFN